MTKRVLLLTVGPRQRASARYRILQFIPELEQLGFELETLLPAPKPKTGTARLFSRMREEAEILRHARRADIVFIQKRLFRQALLRKLHASGVKIVFDFDDSITVTHDEHWSWLTQWKISQRFHATCRQADLVLAGNGYLADQARAYAKRVEILPTVVDFTRYHSGAQGNENRVVLGWIGQPANYCYLQTLAPVLSALSKTHPSLVLRVISRGDIQLDGVAVEIHTWEESREVEDLLAIDIGLMPMPDDEWTRGKCALKAIQYMAAGVPVVCADVGANREVVRDGIDGLLAADETEWLRALQHLIEDKPLRQRMGQCGRERVEQHFSLHEAAKRMAGWFDELLTT